MIRFTSRWLRVPNTFEKTFMFLLQSFYSNKTAVSDLSNLGSFQFSVDIRYTGSHMVYILPLSCYKNNEQLFNKSCQEQQKISRIGSCFRGSRGILQILFPYFCIFYTAPGTIICLSVYFFTGTDTNIAGASLFQTGKCSGQCTGGHCPGPSHGP